MKLLKIFRTVGSENQKAESQYIRDKNCMKCDRDIMRMMVERTKRNDLRSNVF